MNISIDEDQEKEYVGDLEDHRVYVERLSKDDLYFTTIDAKRVTLKDSLERKIISIEDWKNGAWKTEKNGDKEVLQYENYEIVIIDDECVIRPLSDL